MRRSRLGSAPRVDSRPVNEDDAQTGESRDQSPPRPPPPKHWAALSLAAGLFGVAWAVAILVPDGLDLPAWPAASVGIFALLFARAPGPALLRGIGACLGFLGLLVCGAKILALWGFLELLS